MHDHMLSAKYIAPTEDFWVPIVTSLSSQLFLTDFSSPPLLSARCMHITFNYLDAHFAWPANYVPGRQRDVRALAWASIRAAESRCFSRVWFRLQPENIDSGSGKKKIPNNILAPILFRCFWFRPHSCVGDSAIQFWALNRSCSRLCRTDVAVECG